MKKSVVVSNNVTIQEPVGLVDVYVSKELSSQLSM